MARARRRAGDSVLELVRQLGKALADLGLSEIEVASGGVRVRVQRSAAAPPASGAAAPTASAAQPIPAVIAEVEATRVITVEAPMVGTFYRASSPTAEPYMREGDVVKEGQILCIIEAMKLMNEIESKVSGRVVKILVENGHAVEYGQPLVLIEPVG